MKTISEVLSKIVLAAGIALLLSTSALAQTDAPAAYGTWLAVLPPLVAIGLALILKRVVPALFLGVWMGAWIIAGMDLTAIWQGLLDTAQVYVRDALADADHVSVILFSMMIGGMVGIITRNGGILGLVDTLVAWANTARRAAISTSLMGTAVFFDDYANTLVVGSTMRPITDRLDISRQKLAYLVDSTAAPVACLALVTTWIGYEVGLIDEAVSQIDGLDTPAYALFLESIAYSFYPILALLFVWMVVLSGRDFGPMLNAERHARKHGTPEVQAGASEKLDSEMDDELAAIEPPADKPRRAINAVLPVLVLVLGVIGGILATGEGSSLREIVNTSDSYKALVWGSLLGVLTAAILSLTQGILSTEQVVNSWFKGTKSMLFAMIILVLAWSLSDTTQVLGTGAFLDNALSGNLPAEWLPTLTFVLAAATAFATGTAWGTMGILMPLVVPLAWTLAGGNPEQLPILYATIASVLAGAVWGDHCSPISDTTILSSMASGCDHIEHVRTQLPYALLVGVVSILACNLPVAYGLPWWAGLLLAAIILISLLYLFGRRSAAVVTVSPEDREAALT